MILPLVFLLPVYFILVVVYLVVSSINAMHVFRYGKFALRNRLMLTVFAIYTVFVLVVTIGYFLTVDWGQAFELTFPSISVDLPFR